MKVVLRDEAIDDSASGAEFFDKQQVELGNYFVESIFNDLKDLETLPVLHPEIFGVYRKLAKHFPYAIYYLIESDVIEVIAVLDCRRDPKMISTMVMDRNISE